MSPESPIEKAQRLLAKGKHKAAAELFEQAGELLRAGDALTQGGDYKGAGWCYLRAGDRNRAGLAYHRGGDIQRAGTLLVESTERHLVAKGAQLLDVMGDSLKAARAWEKIGEWQHAADSYARIDSERPKVVMCLEKALDKLDPTSPGRALLRSRLAKEYVALGHYRDAATAMEAVGDFKGAAALYENQLQDFESAALAWEKAGDLEHAAKIFLEKLFDATAAAALYLDVGDMRSAMKIVAQAGGIERVKEAQKWHRDYRTGLRAAVDDELTVADLVEISGDRSQDKVLDPESTFDMSQVLTGPALIISAKGKSPKPSKEAPYTKGGLGVDVPNAGPRYIVQHLLGQGGMGVVYKGYDKRLERTVALKFLLSQDELFLKLLHSEARAAARLNHPGIITVFDIEKVDDTSFISMEFAEGMPLNLLLSVENAPARELMMDILLQAAQAFIHAHAQGIVHRDIKPANIFLTGDHRVKVMDFGLAGALQSRESEGLVLGTPSYMAPEQLLGRFDVRSDVFSFGVMSYRVLAGKLPCDGAQFAHSIQQMPPIVSEVPDLDPGVASAIDACLVRGPELRSPDLTRLAEALAAAVATTS